jgi:transcriptional regulator with XRE-family HTH domain
MTLFLISCIKEVFMMFGSRLKLLRKEKGLTQQQLADLLKVGRPTVAGYETKGKEPDFEKIMWMSAFFGVTTDYLLGISNNRGKPLTAKDDAFIKELFDIARDLSDENQTKVLELSRLYLASQGKS